MNFLFFCNYSSVSAEVIPAKVAEKEVPVYSTIIYNPEAQWHQVTEISENESQTDDDTINTKKSTAATSQYEKFMLSGRSEESETLEKFEEKNKNPENLSGNKYENHKSELHGCPCGCGTCVNNKRKGTNDNGKKKTLAEEETILEEECESNQACKYSDTIWYLWLCSNSSPEVSTQLLDALNQSQC